MQKRKLDTLYLVPVQGSDTQWYKNVLKNPSIRIKAGGAEAEVRAAGGPLKPDFGLSAAVLLLDKVFPHLVRVFVPSIPTRSRPDFSASASVLWFAEQEVDMFRHDYIPTQAKTGLEWATVLEANS